MTHLKSANVINDSKLASLKPKVSVKKSTVNAPSKLLILHDCQAMKNVNNVIIKIIKGSIENEGIKVSREKYISTIML